MEGMMHMKAKYKAAGMLFECFHNRGHPETYIPGKKPKNYNALERVAVPSDEIADGVRDNCADWKEDVHQGDRNLKLHNLHQAKKL